MSDEPTRVVSLLPGTSQPYHAAGMQPAVMGSVCLPMYRHLPSDRAGNNVGFYMRDPEDPDVVVCLLPRHEQPFAPCMVRCRHTGTNGDQNYDKHKAAFHPHVLHVAEVVAVFQEELNNGTSETGRNATLHNYFATASSNSASSSSASSSSASSGGGAGSEAPRRGADARPAGINKSTLKNIVTTEIAKVAAHTENGGMSYYL